MNSRMFGCINKCKRCSSGDVVCDRSDCAECNSSEKGLNCLLLRVYFANNPAFILEQNITWQPEIYNIL